MRPNIQNIGMINRASNLVICQPAGLSAACCLRTKCYLLLAAAVLFCTLPPSTYALELSDEDRLQAAQIATATSWLHSENAPALDNAQRRSGSRGLVTATNNHPLGTQTLSIEFDERKEAPREKRARVYQFNYTSRQTRVLVVDIDNNEVVSEQPIQSVHLPLNTVEIEYAEQLLSGASTIVKQLQSEQTRRGDSPFVTLKELDAKASIFEPMQNDHQCKTDRCALFSLFDNTRTVFSTEPVVNLTRGTVMLLQSNP